VTLPWKIQGISETWQITGAKKKKKEARVENSKAAKCKIAGDAYRMSCNAVIIIVAPTVTIIACSLNNEAFLYFLRIAVPKHIMDTPQANHAFETNERSEKMTRGRVVLKINLTDAIVTVVTSVTP
jgi:hypothetical protein